MQLSQHFSLAELTHTDTGLPNNPTPTEVGKLRLLAAKMENVRAILGGRAITVNSAFRSEAVNAKVGGVATSAHRLCYACDFTCAEFGDSLAVARALDAAEKAGKLKFDQLINEGWVHVSFAPALRGQRLTLVGPGQYADGIEATP